MFQFTLQAHAEKYAPSHTIPGHFDGRPLLYHQLRTYQALEQYSLVMNVYPTGTGKTVAALLWLLHPSMRVSDYGNALLVAPTNALVEQHAADVEEFAQRQGLKIAVFRLNARLIDQLQSDLSLRRGERLQRFLENPWTFYQELGIAADAERTAYVIVTNPDIFYLALYFRYGELDKRNVFQQFFLVNFKYVVIDEFHYYDAKQFANFLFFFAFWRTWEMWPREHKVCLLSATPTRHVYRYIDRVLGQDAWTLVGPQNEPPESEGLPTAPTLAPLAVTVTAGIIQDWVAQQRATLLEWPAQQLDTAVISSSLGQINRMYETLRPLNPTRITGPEDQRERRREAAMILATPTVDIGYNFGRAGKKRQSIDRLICDARFGDELIQRIGRAGRVLGRRITDQPSEAVLVLSDDAYVELKPYANRSLTRAEWAELVEQLQALPAKHRLDSYIRSYAVGESFYPILNIRDAGGGTHAEALFTTIKTIFAPNSTVSWKALEYAMRRQKGRKAWLALSEEARWGSGSQVSQATVLIVDQFMRWLSKQSSGDERNGAEPDRALIQDFVKSEMHKQQAEEFIRAQVAISDAVFHFRDSWQATEALIYDPQHLFSSGDTNHYDLLHCVANYRYRLMDRLWFIRETHVDKPAVAYIGLLEHRTTPLVMTFAYATNLMRTQFEQRHCTGITALQGFALRAHEQGTRAGTMLEDRIANALATTMIPCLVAPPELVGALISVTRGTPFFSRECVVTFGNGLTTTYSVIVGTAALHVVSDYSLRAHRMNRQRGQISDEPIFC